MLDLNRWRQSAAPATDAPPTWLRRTVTVLWDNLATLVLLNVVGTLLAAPVLALGLTVGFGGLLVALALTVPLLLGGQMAAVSGEWRSKPGTMWQHAAAALRAQWLPLIALGGMGALAGGASLFTTAQVLTGATGLLFVLWLAQSSVVVTFLALLLYALPLAATRGVGPRLALRNAVVLLIAAPLSALSMIASVVVLTVLLLWGGLGLWLIVPVLLATVLTANCEAQIARQQGADDTA